MTTKAHTAQRFLVNTFFAKGTCARGDKCRFSHKSSNSKSGGKGNKGKKSSSERDRCKKCGKITNSPHWARSCPENSVFSAQVVLTSAPVSSPPDVAPPGLATPVNSSANLAAILRDVLSPGGSSESPEQRDSRLSPDQLDMFVKNSVFAARDRKKHLSMRSASGVSCSQTFLDKRDKVECSVIVGDHWRTLDARRDRGLPLSRHRVSWLCVQSLALSQSLQRCQR